MFTKWLKSAMTQEFMQKFMFLQETAFEMSSNIVISQFSEKIIDLHRFSFNLGPSAAF